MITTKFFFSDQTNLYDEVLTDCLVLVVEVNPPVTVSSNLLLSFIVWVNLTPAIQTSRKIIIIKIITQVYVSGNFNGFILFLSIDICYLQFWKENTYKT